MRVEWFYSYATRAPLNYFVIYARRRTASGSISVARSMVPVCRDGMTSRNSFFSVPRTGSLIFT